MNRGVPERTRSLTHAIPYNDADALRSVIAEYPDQIAAMIMEPMTSTWPVEGYLQAVRDITSDQGIVLVFDEMLTGFRFAPGGAQELFGVVPDLAALGKALSNGFPLSAITGRADILDVMPSIFFSGTFGGETLSLAAARVALDRYATGEPTRVMGDTGARLVDRIEKERPEASRSFLEFSGHSSWTFQQWSIDDAEILAQAKTLFLQEMLRRGVLVLNTHEVTTVHSDADVSAVAAAYAESLSVVCAALAASDMLSRLECEPIRPLFRVR